MKAPEKIYITNDAFEFHGEFSMIEPEGERFDTYIRNDIVETLRAEVARLNKRPCKEVPPGNGFCDHCNNGRPELCRYMNTQGAGAEIDKLRAQLAAAMVWVPIAEADLKDGENFVALHEDGSFYDCNYWHGDITCLYLDDPLTDRITHICRIKPPGEQQ